MHLCERLGLRAFWLARLVGSEPDASGPMVDGHTWQTLILQACRSLAPGLLIQGPGGVQLFGRYGVSGMPVEIDTAVDDGRDQLLLVESKAVADYALSRDEAFIFAAKVQDHEQLRPAWRLPSYAVVASAGRLTPGFAKWCFCQGLDVLDPDRLPLVVLARLRVVLPAAFDRLPRPHLVDWLHEVLAAEAHEIVQGPTLLRRERRRLRVRGSLLTDLNDIQASLTDDIVTCLSGATGEPLLLKRVASDLSRCGIQITAHINKGRTGVAPGIASPLSAEIRGGE